MAILYDARGNEILSNFPDITTGQQFTDGRTISAVLGAINAETVMDLMGCATVTFDVRTAAGALTYLCEGTIDGTNYFSVPMFANFQLLVAAAVAEQYVGSVVVATTHSGSYTVGVTGLRRLRLRVSAYTSGNITVSARGSKADLLIYARPLPAILHVTATAAVNTAITATLPAVAGMFHYITRVELIKLYSVIGVAAGAGVIITSTNLPGTPAWTTEQLASAAGSAPKVIDMNLANPLKSLVVGTATTFVAGVQLQTIWRWNVSYYLGA